MVAEGFIEEADMDLFNIPYYTPFIEEVRAKIEEEGSFNLGGLDTFEVNWDPIEAQDDIFDKYKNGKNFVNIIRAISEPILANHFGESIIENVFEKYAKYMKYHYSTMKKTNVNIIVSLTKE